MSRIIALAALAGAALGGCKQAAVQPAVTAPPRAHADFAAAGWSSADEAAVQTYGYGAVARPAGLTYQPDVVVVEGGPGIIRSVSADGFVWIIDGRAPGSRELAPGKVMFATARAVGRVVAVQREGDDLAVTLVPVKLTEVIRQGVIEVDQDLDAALVGYQEAPSRTGGGGESAAKATLSPALWHPDGRQAAPTRIALPALRFAAKDLSTDGDPQPASRKNSFKVTRGSWEFEPYVKSDTKEKSVSHRFGLKVQRAMGGGKGEFGEGGKYSVSGLKIGLDASLYARKLHVKTRLPIDDGLMHRMSFQIEGLQELDIDIRAGVTDGLKDNQKVRFEVPVEVVVPIPPTTASGIPLCAQFKFKVFIETAFSAKNSTLTAHGRYSLEGPIGYIKDQLVGPTMTLLDSMSRSLDGISAGANGFVWAAELRILIGLGSSDMMFGPYAKFTFSLGLWRGSDFGSLLAVCKGAVLKVDTAVGFGFLVSSGVDEALEKVLGKKVKLEAELLETTVNIWNKKSVWPDVPLCRIS